MSKLARKFQVRYGDEDECLREMREYLVFNMVDRSRPYRTLFRREMTRLGYSREFISKLTPVGCTPDSIVYVYMLANEANHKVYIGSTTYIKDRVSKHRRAMIEYPKRKLYRAMSEIGPDKFYTRILSVTTGSERHMVEQKYIGIFDAIKSGYNSFKALKE